MQHSTLLAATVAALSLASLVNTAAHAAPADDGYVTRPVRSQSGKDYFVRLVKVPKAQTVADGRDCPKPMKAKCADMMGDHRNSDSAPKG